MHRDYDYLIVGAGMVADSAARGIRERDETGTIGILGDEPTLPFPRPALSKKLWTDPDFTTENTALDTVGATGAEIHTGTTVTALDPDARRVSAGPDARGDDPGDTYGYGRLLLATGGHPTRIDGLEPGERVLYFRTLTDYHHLRDLTDGRPRVVVVGGGYIGTEIAAALAGVECEVVLVHPDAVLNATKFPARMAQEFEDLFTDAGVELLPGRSVVGGSSGLDGVTLALDDGSRVEADVAVVGLGIEPASVLASNAGLRVVEDGGILVDERLSTSAPSVWAAGDVASYPDPILGRTRVEHVDNATTMGAGAGRIMAGSEEAYDHTPYFYSAVFGVRYEAVGTLDSSLETASSEGPEAGAQTVRYLGADGGVVGVLLWNVSGEDEAARDEAREAIRGSGGGWGRD